MANATFGTVAYRDGGILVIPVTFAENVIAAAKTIFPITHISGDALAGLDYYLIGKDTDFEIIVTVPPDRSGSFQISANGDVLLSTGSWDTVAATALTVTYNTTVPRLVDFDVPGTYAFGENFDVRLAFNTIVSGWHANNSFTEIWIEEGARLGTPTPYKWTGTSPPDFTTAVPDDLTGTDWQALATPPPGHQGEFHGEEAQYFLMRIEVTNADATGIAQFTLRPNSSLRGPVA